MEQNEERNQTYEIEVIAVDSDDTPGLSMGTVTVTAKTEKDAVDLASNLLWDDRLDVTCHRRFKVKLSGPEAQKLAEDVTCLSLVDIDMDNCRVYYRRDALIYAFQRESRNCYALFECTSSGEPMVQVPIRSIKLAQLPSDHDEFCDWVKSVDITVEVSRNVPDKAYRVHLYGVVRVPYEVAAASEADAIARAEASADMYQDIRNGEYAEELTGALVDELSADGDVLQYNVYDIKNGDWTLAGSKVTELKQVEAVNATHELDEDEIRDFLTGRIESGDMLLEDITKMMARYGLMDPKAFQAEMRERIDEFNAEKDSSPSPGM